jgi:hypothetical protein
MNAATTKRFSPEAGGESRLRRASLPGPEVKNECTRLILNAQQAPSTPAIPTNAQPLLLITGENDVQLPDSVTISADPAVGRPKFRFETSGGRRQR